MDRLARLLKEQHGIVHLDQLREIGVSRATVRWRLRSGRWRTVLPQVYATFTGDCTDWQRTVAAALYAGPSAQVAGTSALRILGLRYLPADGGLVHILIPHGRRRVSTRFVRIHRAVSLDPRPWHNAGIPFCGPARAVVDAARELSSLRAVRAMVAEVVQRDLATVAKLRAELDRGRRNGSGLLRRALEVGADGARSAPEAELRLALAGSDLLPRVRWNPQLVDAGGRRLPTPDGWIDDVGLALEVDSREYHLSPEDWERTLARHTRFAEHGVLVLHFPPSRVRRHAEVRAAVERAYRQRRQAGTRPAVRMRRS
jgi:hypothetical protein